LVVIDEFLTVSLYQPNEFISRKVCFSFVGDRLENGSLYAVGPFSVLSVMLVCCGKTVGWIKKPLVTEVGLGPATLF